MVGGGTFFFMLWLFFEGQNFLEGCFPISNHIFEEVSHFRQSTSPGPTTRSGEGGRAVADGGDRGGDMPVLLAVGCVPPVTPKLHDLAL